MVWFLLYYIVGLFASAYLQFVDLYDGLSVRPVKSLYVIAIGALFCPLVLALALYVAIQEAPR
jgi:hypothetical protein